MPKFYVTFLCMHKCAGRVLPVFAESEREVRRYLTTAFENGISKVYTEKQWDHEKFRLRYLKEGPPVDLRQER